MSTFNFKVSITKDYKENEIHSHARIIVPDKLPIKLTLNGNREIINVGEFAIIPPHCRYAVNSSPARFVIDFDFALITENCDFTALRPFLYFPCIYHPQLIERDKGFRYSGYTSWYIPDILRAELKENKNVADSAEILGEKSLLAKYQIKKVNEPTMIIAGSGYSPYEYVRNIVAAQASDEYPFFSSICMTGLTSIYTILCGEIIAVGFNKENFGREETSILNNMAKAIEFIHQNPQGHLTLDEVSEASGYNKSYFSRLFKDFYGIQFSDYLQFVRIRQACLLLTTTDKGISEAAEEAGFNSSSTLNRVFKAFTGYSPREYKKLFNL
jgi:AraC-like DNA-binding protein